MAELPRITPNKVSNYKGPSRNLTRYQSDSRVETRVASSCDGANASFELQYKALDDAQIGTFIEFFDVVGLSWDSRFSLESFEIPRNHPLWHNVNFFARLENHWLWADTIDDALWIVTDPSTVNVELCGFNDFSFRVEEVIDV